MTATTQAKHRQHDFESGNRLHGEQRGGRSANALLVNAPILWNDKAKRDTFIKRGDLEDSPKKESHWIAMGEEDEDGAKSTQEREKISHFFSKDIHVIKDDAPARPTRGNSGSGVACPIWKRGQEDTCEHIQDEARMDQAFFSFPCNRSQLAHEKKHFYLFCLILFKYLEYRHSGEWRELKVRIMAVLERLYSAEDDDEVAFFLSTYHELRRCVSARQWKDTFMYYNRFIFQKRRERLQRRVSAPSVVED